MILTKIYSATYYVDITHTIDRVGFVMKGKTAKKYFFPPVFFSFTLLWLMWVDEVAILLMGLDADRDTK